MSTRVRRTHSAGWPLERVLFAMAGTVVLVSVLLAAAVSEWFLLLTGFVGVSLSLYAVVGACPASLVVERLFHLPSAIYCREEVKAR